MAMHAEPSNPPINPDSERDHLEETHHELCTALTSVRSNVALLRIEMRDVARAEREVHIAAHLLEVETAVDRLVRLASTLRGWHAGGRRGGR